jgi:hypothetical protein
MIDAVAAPMRNHKFAQFIRVKYHSVSTRQPWFWWPPRHHADLFSNE